MERLQNIGDYRTVNAYVAAKLERFFGMERTFRALFQLMFSEKENVMYEKSVGFQVETTTYGEAFTKTCELAGILQARLKGVPRDSVIGLYLENDLSWIEFFWAILAAGYRPLLLNIRLDDEVLTEALEAAGACAVISAQKSFAPCFMLSAAELLPTETKPLFTEAEFGSEILVMSSGTTQTPKLCAYTAEAFYYQIGDSAAIIRKSTRIKMHYHGQLKQLTFLPFYHVFGLIAVYIWFAFFSRTFVHLSDFSAATILQTIRKHEVTHIFAVPMFWNTVYAQALKTIRDKDNETQIRFQKGMALAKKIGDVPVLGAWFTKRAFREIREKLFGESVCFMISGGSEISTEVLTFFNSIGYHLTNGYGATEIGITSVELRNRRKPRNSGAVGRPLRSVEYRINEAGELLVRGKTTASYLIERTEKKPNEGWFNTHDLAEEKNGYYYILGRKDDLVVSETGENLNPNLIESLLSEGLSNEVCLIGPKENGAVVPTLLVSTGKRLSEEEFNALQKRYVEKLHATHLNGEIRKIFFTKEPLIYEDEIKRNRTRLKRAYLAGKLPEMKPYRERCAEQRSQTFRYVRGLFAEVLHCKEEEITGEGDFFLTYGGNSLAYFTVIAILQDELGISFPMSEGKGLNTVNEICDFIEERKADEN